MIIKSYLCSVLQPQLQVMGLNKKQQDLVCGDIHVRLSSLLGNWDDTVFRKTALLLGTEDAIFYQPANVDLEIRALVVVGIRNSMLEDFSADRPFMKEFVSVARCLPDSFVPMITSQAVAFFASAYREMGGWKISAPSGKADVFRSFQDNFLKVGDDLSCWQIPICLNTTCTMKVRSGLIHLRLMKDRVISETSRRQS